MTKKWTNFTVAELRAERAELLEEARWESDRVEAYRLRDQAERIRVEIAERLARVRD